MKSQWGSSIYDRVFAIEINFPFSFLSSVWIVSGRILQFLQVSSPKSRRQIFSSKHKVDFLFFGMAQISILFDCTTFYPPILMSQNHFLEFDRDILKIFNYFLAKFFKKKIEKNIRKRTFSIFIVKHPKSLSISPQGCFSAFWLAHTLWAST